MQIINKHIVIWRVLSIYYATNLISTKCS